MTDSPLPRHVRRQLEREEKAAKKASSRDTREVTSLSGSNSLSGNTLTTKAIRDMEANQRAAQDSERANVNYLKAYSKGNDPVKFIRQTLNQGFPSLKQLKGWNRTLSEVCSEDSGPAFLLSAFHTLTREGIHLRLDDKESAVLKAAAQEMGERYPNNSDLNSGEIDIAISEGALSGTTDRHLRNHTSVTSANRVISLLRSLQDLEIPPSMAERIQLRKEQLAMYPDDFLERARLIPDDVAKSTTAVRYVTEGSNGSEEKHTFCKLMEDLRDASTAYAWYDSSLKKARQKTPADQPAHLALDFARMLHIRAHDREPLIYETVLKGVDFTGHRSESPSALISLASSLRKERQARRKAGSQNSKSTRVSTPRDTRRTGLYNYRGKSMCSEEYVETMTDKMAEILADPNRETTAEILAAALGGIDESVVEVIEQGLARRFRYTEESESSTGSAAGDPTSHQSSGMASSSQ